MIKYWVKQHGQILAICDETVMGKELKHNETKIKIKEEFYKGELIEENDLRKLIAKFGNINAIGNSICSLITEKLDIDESLVINISGVNHIILIDL